MLTKDGTVYPVDVITLSNQIIAIHSLTNVLVDRRPRIKTNTRYTAFREHPAQALGNPIPTRPGCLFSLL